LLTTGCAASFVDPRVPAGEESTEWLDFYLIGAVGREHVDVRNHCATARAHEVRVGGNILTVGVSILTLGIYTPRKATITCEALPPTPTPTGETATRASAPTEGQR